MTLQRFFNVFPFWVLWACYTPERTCHSDFGQNLLMWALDSDQSRNDKWKIPVTCHLRSGVYQARQDGDAYDVEIVDDH